MLFHAHARIALAVIGVCTLCSVTLHAAAASNGRIGSSSTGTVSISLSIPATRQVHLASHAESPRSAGEHLHAYCIGVSDRSVRARPRDYHFEISKITESHNDNTARQAYLNTPQDSESIAAQQKFSARIKSTRSAPLTDEEICAMSFGHTLSVHHRAGANPDWILRLVPE